MEEKKTWFIGYTSRFWLPVSIEGWLVTAALFFGIFVIVNINHVSNNASLNVSQLLPIVLEFAGLVGVLYLVTRGRVDKRY